MKTKRICFFVSILIVFIFSVSPVMAFAESGASDWYVADSAGILTEQELVELELEARRLSLEHEIGLYIVTVEDHTQYGNSDVFEVATIIYEEYDMGYGEDRNGAILLLSMNTREFAYAAYGSKAKNIFDDDAMITIEDGFLYYFGMNHWFAGFEEFLDLSETQLQTWLAFPLLISFIIAIALTIVVGLYFKGQLKSVAKKQSASGYIATTGGVTMTVTEDRFTHTTQSRVKIQSSSSSRSSSSRSSGGFSGRSGRF